ncbi:MAG: FAD-dependent oxidoreductase [Lentisphaerae bacterium]|jgi:hypothetical protein|nr:FAD-dependent oxidoreductase [Lentisphaerota bacterium]MBT4817482.1 FAD-dependent oxidoreductase [Lentisphaerota bacterium]MBT5612735.1 FAD-dependent oxidoreductase [Lentisphaerota bacterium]MBT7058964.1 FAD-dependent oxidoreductase [Lentisphaerota bacterium]MBT7848384.1 FAD-dependent oxidoreductase [Lentisphaerota bacterium]
MNKTLDGRRVDWEGEVDILVIGSGVAAVCAALAAARNGCRTALVEMDQCLGGNSSPLLGVHVSGAHSFHPYASETGIVEELELDAALLGAKTRTWGHHYNISFQWDLVLADALAEAGVEVHRQHQGRQAFWDGRRVTAVLVEDVQHFRTKLFHIRHGVIDGSGDGIVSVSAGASFMRGTEGRDVFGERSAPEASSAETMGTSITALVRKCSYPVPFSMPRQFARRAEADDPHKKLGGPPASWRPEDEQCFLWVTESGGERDTILADAEIREEILYQLYRMWDNVKNFSFVDKARNWELVWVSPKSGKRESHRFTGDYVLTQTDVEMGRVFEDAIGYGGYGVDIHEVDGKRARVVFHSIPPLWSFPYRCSYSCDFDNLWFAGRLMSVSHLALGTVRLMRTLGCIGQGVGTAAALAKVHACTARDVYERHRQELQQALLRQDATILTAVNEDPDDLARGATVTASSEMRHGATRVTGHVPLDCFRGVQLWDWADQLRSVSFAVRNTTAESKTVTLTLELHQRDVLWKHPRDLVHFQHVTGAANRMEWGSDNRVVGFSPVAWASACVPPGFDGWACFEFADPVRMAPVDPTSDETRYNAVLSPCSGVDVGVDVTPYDFALQLWREGESDTYAVSHRCHAFRLDPAPSYGEAANVINGHNRRYSTNPVHAWLSEPDRPLPQHIELVLPTAQEMARVHVTFDTIDRAYRDAPINCAERVVGRCVSSYRLDVRSAEGWQTVADVDENHQRHRVHAFPPCLADAVRLSILRVHDPACRARVYEVRVYGPELT